MSTSIRAAVRCEYCRGHAELVGGSAIYPHRPDLDRLRFWRCAPCDAYVGCHPGTENPLGRLANAELRAAKIRAHDAFDPLWKSRKIRRSEAYRRLAKHLGIDDRDCHIGMFDVETCARVVAFARSGQ
jgi:hypothetical protein